MMRARVTLGVVLSLLLASVAIAAPPKTPQDEAKDKARNEYSEAMKNYNLGEYAPALEHFKEAYRAYPEPSFLFNLGQCQRALGQKVDAIRSYRAYLRQAKANRAEVEQIVASLEKAVAEETAAQNKTPVGMMPPTGVAADPSHTDPIVTKPQPVVVKPQPVVVAKPEPVVVVKPQPVVVAKPEPVVVARVEPRPEPTPIRPEVRPEPVVVTPEPTTTPETKAELTAAPAEKKPVYKKGWFWGVIVGVVLVVGAGVGVGVALSSSKTTYPSTGPSDGTFKF